MVRDDLGQRLAVLAAQVGEFLAAILNLRKPLGIGLALRCQRPNSCASSPTSANASRTRPAKLASAGFGSSADTICVYAASIGPSAPRSSAANSSDSLLPVALASNDSCSLSSSSSAGEMS